MSTYDQTRFRATHNSYSGEARGSIVDQLNCGVRVIELDFHARGYAALGDFRVGHLKPGTEVARGGGNPDSLMLSDWLAVVARWSDEHVHAPITVVLDSKDDLTADDCGGLEDLNHKLATTFGARLFTRDDYDAAGRWPETSDMLNRVVCVLSGHGNTRASYRWAYGTQPALSINARGDVVLVYRSTAGDLNAFLGRIEDPAVTTWQHKGTYSFSKLPLSEPVVAVNDDGWVVASHRFEPPRGFVGSRLESIVGHITEARRLEWRETSLYGEGRAPRLAISGADVREVHTLHDLPQESSGVLDTRRGQVTWGRGRRATNAPPLPSPDQAAFQSRSYACAVDATGALVCGPTGALRPVRFRQLMFVEEQKGDSRSVLPDALFFAADAKDKAVIDAHRSQVVRAWGFEECDVPCAAMIAATDAPTAPWYQGYTSGAAVAG